MIKTSIAAALALALAAGTASAEFKDFTVNGELVTKAYQENVAAAALAGSQNPHAMINPQLEEQVKDMIVENKVMARYARQNGIDQLPAVQSEIQATTEMILSKASVGEYLRANPVEEKEIRAEYDKEAARWGDTEYRIRHIMLKDEAEAKAVIADIEKGASFAKTAAEKSLDTESKDQGGILDWNSASVYTGDLANQIRMLKKGEMAKTPVQSPAGWHVLKVEDVRPAELFPKYEDRQAELRHVLMQRKVQAFIHNQVLGAEVKDAEAK